MHPAPQPSQPVERKPLKLRCIEQRDEKAAVLLDYLDACGVENAERRVSEAKGESEWGLSFPLAVVVEAPEKVLRPIAAFQLRRGYAVGCLTGHVVPDEREGREGQHRVALRFVAQVLPKMPPRGTLLGYVNDEDAAWVAPLLVGFSRPWFYLRLLTGRAPHLGAVVTMCSTGRRERLLTPVFRRRREAMSTRQNAAPSPSPVRPGNAAPVLGKADSVGAGRC